MAWIGALSLSSLNDWLITAMLSLYFSHIRVYNAWLHLSVWSAQGVGRSSELQYSVFIL